MNAEQTITRLRRERDEARDFAEKQWRELEDHNGHMGGCPMDPPPWVDPSQGRGFGRYQTLVRIIHPDDL